MNPPGAEEPDVYLTREDDVPRRWEEFRLLVPPGNVGRLYTGSSRQSASSFLPRHLIGFVGVGTTRLLIAFIVVSGSEVSSRSSILGKFEPSKEQPEDPRTRASLNYPRA
jgi:hypothetical protein